MSPYEMQQACLAQLPSLICPEIPEIQRFISDQVNKRKKGAVEGDDGSDDSGGSDDDEADNDGEPRRRRKFTRAEKEQKRAERLERELFLLKSVNTNLIGMRFEKKYVGKYLMQEKDSGEVRVVMNVKYCQEKECWYAETIEAEVDEIDDRKYIPVEDGDNSNVFIGRGSDKLGKCIKWYNQWADLSK